MYSLMMLVIGMLLGGLAFNDPVPLPRLEKFLVGYGMFVLLVFVISVMAHLDIPLLNEMSNPDRRRVLLTLATSWAPLAGYKAGLHFGLEYTGQIK